MKRIIFPLLITFTLASCATVQQLLTEPTAWETVSALKKVLNSSAFKTIDKLAQVNESGVESLLPDDLKPVLATLKTLGLSDEIDQATKAISAASGVALVESKGIVQDAIKEVKFEDAASVVLGGENAATVLMKNAMYGAVKKRYSEKLDVELSKSEAPKYWPMAQSAYNIFAKKKINGSLSDFLAERAVDALFIGMGKEEAVIRQNPNALGDAVVSKVFDYYKNKQS